MDQDEIWHADCVRWGPSSPSRKGRQAPSIFGPYLLQSNGWMYQIQDATWYGVGLSPGDFVLDADPALPPQKWGQSPLSNFRPIFIVVKRLQYRCMHQDATWYGGRPQPRGHCVRWKPSPPKFSAYVYYSYCDIVRTLHKAHSLLVYSSSSSSFIFYAFHF